MNILALDCAIRTGWGTLIDGNIHSGVQENREKTNESAGMKYLRFDAWLIEMNNIGNFDVIYYEKPHGLKGQSVESMNGFITGIHRFIAKYDHIEYRAVSPSTIKKWATGKGNADKDAVKEYFRKETGKEPVDDNEADAYALLRYAMYDLGVKDGT